MNATRRRRAAGITLIDMVFYLSMMVLIFAAAGGLFNATWTTARDAHELEAQGPRLDRVLDRFKSDAWSATRAVVADGGRRVEFSTEARRVVWRTTDAGGLARADGGADGSAWPGFGVTLRFEEAPAGVRIVVADAAVLAPVPAKLEGAGR